MLITLSRRSAICQSVAEVQLTGVTPLGAVSHRFIFLLLLLLCYNISIRYMFLLMEMLLPQL